MKTTLSIELIKYLANDVMLELDDSECLQLQEDFYIILQQMNNVANIDTESISMMHYPISNYNTYLRPDDLIETINKTELLNNAPVHNEDYIVIGKVIE